MFLEAARAGTESSLKIGATVGVIGIIIGVHTLSGLVLTFADIVIELAEGSLVLTILLIALASLVLGDGGSGDRGLSDHCSRRGPGIDPSWCE